MRRIQLLVALLIATGCRTVPSPPGPLFVAEGIHHFEVVTAVAPNSANAPDEAAIRAAVQAMRTMPGNLAVSLLRGNGEWMVISEWRSQEDAQQCARDATCTRLLETTATRDFEVLFEATQFDAVP
jgi:quinol monooxygenase YgiN